MFPGGVGADNAIHFALGTFQIFFFTKKNIEFVLNICIIIEQNPICSSFLLKLHIEYR